MITLMESLSKPVINESSSSEEKKEISQSQSKIHKVNKKLLIIIASIIIIAIIFGLSFIILYQSSSSQSNNPVTTTNQITPSLTPIVTPTTQRLNIYTINGSSFNKLTSILPEKGFQGQTPITDSAGNIYYVDQNLVMQFSLQTQESRVIYTNTKIGTKISNLTFISPSLLYISIILNPLDPNYSQQADPNSYLVEYNLASNALRTIGPFPTLTNGSISYLFSSAGRDVINYVKQTYCKGEGEVYLYSTGSATFITKDGEGCNGSDPYLIGSLPNANSLLLSLPYSNSTPDGFVSEYGNLYIYNITNLSQNTIIDLGTLLPANLTAPISDMPNQINKFAVSDDNQTIYYLLGAKIYIINVNARSVTQTLDLSSYNGYAVIAIVKNKVYLFNNNKSTFAIIDIPTNTVTNLPQTIMINPTQINEINYLGTWNNELLFYTQSVNN